MIDIAILIIISILIIGEIMFQSKEKKFKTCKAAFESIGLKYLEEKYVCYNMDIGPCQELCPFAKNDTCKSEELPD